MPSVEFFFDELPPTSPPNNQTVVLPRARDSKADVAVGLAMALQQVGFKTNLTGTPDDSRDLTITKSGSFHQSNIRDANYQERPVIVVQRSSTKSVRVGLSDYSGLFDSSALVEPATPTGGAPINLQPHTPAHVHSKLKETLIDIIICDMNSQRADFMNDLIEAICDTILEPALITDLGYLSFIQTAGADSTTIFNADEVGGTFTVFQRSLTYEVKYYTHVENVLTLASVIQQQFTMTGDPGKVVRTADV